MLGGGPKGRFRHQDQLIGVVSGQVPQGFEFSPLYPLFVAKNGFVDPSLVDPPGFHPHHLLVGIEEFGVANLELAKVGIGSRRHQGSIPAPHRGPPSKPEDPTLVDLGNGLSSGATKLEADLAKEKGRSAIGQVLIVFLQELGRQHGPPSARQVRVGVGNGPTRAFGGDEVGRAWLTLLFFVGDQCMWLVESCFHFCLLSPSENQHASQRLEHWKTLQWIVRWCQFVSSSSFSPPSGNSTTGETLGTSGGDIPGAPLLLLSRGRQRQSYQTDCH